MNNDIVAIRKATDEVKDDIDNLKNGQQQMTTRLFAEMGNLMRKNTKEMDKKIEDINKQLSEIAKNLAERK